MFFSNILSRETKATLKIKSDKKYFFKYVNRYRKTLSDCPKLLIDDNGNAVSDPQRIADLFQDQFKSVFSTPLTESQLNNYSLISGNPMTSIPSFEITQEHIIDAINDMKGSSSCPNKDIPARVFKQCKLTLSKPLMLFWKASFACGEIPKSYKNQMIIPIYKKGPKTCAKNWRPICLSGFEVKIMERVLKKTDYILFRNVQFNKCKSTWFSPQPQLFNTTSLTTSLHSLKFCQRSWYR